MNVTVQAYSGYKANERPQRFQLEDRHYEVLEVLDRWYGPESVYFKVKAGDQNYYILQYHPGQDEWSLESFRRASGEEGAGGGGAGQTGSSSPRPSE